MLGLTRVSQWMSGELKSPMIMMSVDGLFCGKFEITSFMYRSLGLDTDNCDWFGKN